MKPLWAVLVAILATLTGTAILGDLVCEEIRGRLDRLPNALIRIAPRRLPPDVREDLAQEWIAELHEILRGAEALPVTRLYRGIRYALGLLRTAPSIGRDISSGTASPRGAGKASDIRRRLVRLIADDDRAATVDTRAVIHHPEHIRLPSGSLWSRIEANYGDFHQLRRLLTGERTASAFVLRESLESAPEVEAVLYFPSAKGWPLLGTVCSIRVRRQDLPSLLRLVKRIQGLDPMSTEHWQLAVRR